MVTTDRVQEIAGILRDKTRDSVKIALDVWAFTADGSTKKEWSVIDRNVHSFANFEDVEAYVMAYTSESKTEVIEEG